MHLVQCQVKFGAMVEYARRKALSLTNLQPATMPRIVERDGRYAIARALDIKEETNHIFLYRLSQQQLARTVFPLGSMTKEEVRRSMSTKGSTVQVTRKARISTPVLTPTCLMLPNQTGNIVDKTGAILGTHQRYLELYHRSAQGLGCQFRKALVCPCTAPFYE